MEGQRHAKAAATALLEQKLCWLTLTGDCGTGKSHIAIGIGWAWLERGRGCRYAVVSALLDRLRATYDVSPQQAFQLNQPDFERVFGWYCDIPLLILDDLGMEKRTEWGLEKLDYLFDYRYLRSLPLVVATNEVIDKLPPRIQDRLMDKRLGRVVVLSGPSYRST